MSKNKKSNKQDLNKIKPKILSLKYDIVFKKIFGDKRNEEHLRNFLKAVIDIPENEFDDYSNLTFVDTHLKRESQNDKLAIVDVMIKTKSEKTIHIEIQVLKQTEMPERIAYYMSKIIAGQLNKKQHYNKLKKTICIVIADFDMFDSKNYAHKFKLLDESDGTIFTDLIEIHTFELRKLPQNSDNTEKYNWLKFIKAEEREEFDMIAKANFQIRDAYEELKRVSLSKKMQAAYEYKLKAMRDADARERYLANIPIEAERKATEEGMKKGMEKGMEKGIQETIEKMRKVGISEDKINDVLKLN